MTEFIYLKDNYAKEFDARILENTGAYLVLDRTAFYPEGGGQPTDTGTLNGVRVKQVLKKGADAWHYVEKPLPPDATEVHGVLDWQPRYARMRMHTAQHLLSAIVLDAFSASTAGNQIHEDRSRIDFHPWSPTEEDVEKVKRKFNEYVRQAIPVEVYITTRDKVMEEIDPKRRNLFSRVPPIVKDIRVIEIIGVDKCPCAGTHVANTREIGELDAVKAIRKGADTTRVEYTLKR